jgi:hypothetical protein
MKDLREERGVAVVERIEIRLRQPLDLVDGGCHPARHANSAVIAAERARIEHTLYRVSGRTDAALRAVDRARTKTNRIDAPVLVRMPLVDQPRT